jgi:hypothetical protein
MTLTKGRQRSHHGRETIPPRNSYDHKGEFSCATKAAGYRGRLRFQIRTLAGIFPAKIQI